MNTSTWNLTYNIFIKGTLYIVHGLGDVISYLSGQKILDLIFNSENMLSPQFILFFITSISLIIFFSGSAIIYSMLGNNIKKELTALANRLLIILLLMMLVPLFFWIIGFIIISLIHIIMPNLIDGTQLANMVGKLGFVNNSYPDNWQYDQNPDLTNYNLFLGIFSALFFLFIFFFLSLNLIKLIFNLFVLYVISPLVLSTAASNYKWQKVNIWKDLVISKFTNILGIILILTLFMNLQPLIFNLANKVSDKWTGQIAFKLLFIVSSGLASLNVQKLISKLIGANSITDGISIITNSKILNLSSIKKINYEENTSKSICIINTNINNKLLSTNLNLKSKTIEESASKLSSLITTKKGVSNE